MPIHQVRVLKEGVSSMEPWLSFTNTGKGNHSFLRCAKDGSKSKKEGKAVERVFDPMLLDDGCMDKSLMLTAFSA